MVAFVRFALPFALAATLLPHVSATAEDPPDVAAMRAAVKEFEAGLYPATFD